MNRTILTAAIVLSTAVLFTSVGVMFEFALAVPGADTRNPPANIPLFQFERQAQLHCPDDSVVWATAAAGSYDLSADRWYGRTSDGAFGCLHEAENAGYRVQRSER